MKKRRPPQQGQQQHLIVTPELLHLFRRGRTLRSGSAACKAIQDELRERLGLLKFGADVFGQSSLVCCSSADIYPILCTCALARRWQAALERADREAAGEQ
jgi:hypothetical protein